MYIIGGGTVRYSTDQQRTFAYNASRQSRTSSDFVARSVFVLQMTCANNAVRSGEFDDGRLNFSTTRTCSTLLLFGGSSVNNLQLCVR